MVKNKPPVTAMSIVEKLTGPDKSFNYKKMMTAFGKLAIEDHSDELVDIMANKISTSKTFQEYGTLQAILTLLSATYFNTDKIVNAILEHKDLNSIYKKNFEYQLLRILMSASDDVFIKFYKTIINKGIVPDIMIRLLARLATIKEYILDEAEISYFNKNLKKIMENYTFKDNIPVLIMLSKQSESIKEIFKDLFSQTVDSFQIPKYTYDDNHYKRIGIMKAIKNVRDKELRKFFIRKVLVKNTDYLNKALIKDYPKYTKYLNVA